MQPSSSFCRAQEARHHVLASDATLENVRLVANAAAAAWAREAVAAELREARQLRIRAMAAAQAEPDHHFGAGLRGAGESPVAGTPDAGDATPGGMAEDRR